MGDMSNNEHPGTREIAASDRVEERIDHPVYQAIVNAIPDMIIRISRDGIFQSFESEVIRARGA